MKKPTIVMAAASSIITEIAVLFFFREYLAVCTVVLLLGILVAQSEAAGIAIGFLMSLLFNYWQLNQIQEMRIVGAIILLLSALNIVYVVVARIGLAAASSLVQNILFAFIGQAISIVYLSVAFSIDKLKEIGLVLESAGARGDVTEILRIYGNVLCLTYLMSPMVLGPLFAVLRQRRFNLSQPFRIVMWTFLGGLACSMVVGPILCIGSMALPLLRERELLNLTVTEGDPLAWFSLTRSAIFVVGLLPIAVCSGFVAGLDKNVGQN